MCLKIVVCLAHQLSQNQVEVELISEKIWDGRRGIGKPVFHYICDRVYSRTAGGREYDGAFRYRWSQVCEAGGCLAPDRWEVGRWALLNCCAGAWLPGGEEDEATVARVREMLAKVRAGGELACREYAASLDNYTGPVVVTWEEVEQQTRDIPQKDKDTIDYMVNQVRPSAKFSQAALPCPGGPVCPRDPISSERLGGGAGRGEQGRHPRGSRHHRRLLRAGRALRLHRLRCHDRGHRPGCGYRKPVDQCLAIKHKICTPVLMTSFVDSQTDLLQRYW